MAKKGKTRPGCAVSHLVRSGRSACPRCGGEMAEAKYYTAVHTGSSISSDHNWSQQTTTRVDYYRDLCLCRGGLCISCFRAEHRALRRWRLLEAAAFALLALLCRICFGQVEDLSLSFLMGCFSFFGAIPFVASGYLTSPTDAYFETMSGFTTTGATLIEDVESLPHALLFWRSMTQWIGGLGIVFFTIAIIPSLIGGSVKVFTAEATGPMRS